jgi:hypothetical protein
MPVSLEGIISKEEEKKENNAISFEWKKQCEAKNSSFLCFFFVSKFLIHVPSSSSMKINVKVWFSLARRSLIYKGIEKV